MNPVITAEQLTNRSHVIHSISESLVGKEAMLARERVL